MQIKTEVIQWCGNVHWPCKGHVPKMEQRSLLCLKMMERWKTPAKVY